MDGLLLVLLLGVVALASVAAGGLAGWYLRTQAAPSPIDAAARALSAPVQAAGGATRDELKKVVEMALRAWPT